MNNELLKTRILKIDLEVYKNTLLHVVSMQFDNFPFLESIRKIKTIQELNNFAILNQKSSIPFVSWWCRLAIYKSVISHGKLFIENQRIMKNELVGQTKIILE